MPTDAFIPPAFVGLMSVSAPDALADDRSPIEKLFTELGEHEKEEQDILKDYEAAANNAPDAGFRYLMGLIAEDEERHHRLSKAMADEVEKSLKWLQGERPLPAMHPTAKEREELLRQTDRFLRIERDGERQLSDLREHVKSLHAGLLELIVSMMSVDTQKHIRILKYIKDRLEEG